MLKRRNGLVAAILSMALTVSVLASCGRQEEEGGAPASAQPKGRYVETELTLPEELKESEIRQIMRVDDSLHLLLQSNEDGSAGLQEWMLNEDGSFAEVTQEWLEKLPIPYEQYGNLKLLQDEDGTQYVYACYAEEGEDLYQGHLWRSEGNGAVNITPEKWTVMEEQYGFYDYPGDITVTDVGTLVSHSFMAVDVISAEDGSLISTNAPEGYYGDWIAYEGGKLYQYTMGNTGEVEALEVRSYEQGTVEETISFSQEQYSMVYFDVAEDGALTAAYTDGFFKYEPEEEDWKKIINGADTSFAFTNMWCKGIVTLPGGSYYALFGSDDGTKLMQYKYDPDAVVEVTETLTLYTVTESFLLQQAAALYHKEHPEVMIEIDAGFSLMESYTMEPDYNQIYQELNTALMGDNGPDILVLDGLPMESYASKGLLVDIEDIVAPLEEDGSLLENVTGSYRTEDGSRYVVPLQFGMMLAIGRDLTGEEIYSMEILADTLEKGEESYMGPQTVTELVDKFYPLFTEEIVQDKQLQRKALAVRLEQLKKIADNCGMLEKREEDTWCYNIWDIAARCKLAFYKTNGFNQAMTPISATNLVKGAYTCLEETFYPKLEMGINSKSEHQETAKDFLAFALSEAVQSTDYYEGFPVNTVSLETLAEKDRTNAEAYTSIEIAEGVYEEFEIKSFAEEDADRLVNMCKEVSVRAKEDAQIRQVFIETLPEYLNGSKSLKETLDAIDGSLKMYLSEYRSEQEPSSTIDNFS